MSTFVNTSFISQKIRAGFWSNGNTWFPLRLGLEKGGEEVLWGGDGAVRWILGLSGEFQAFLTSSAFLQACTSSYTQSSHTQNSHLFSNTQTQNTHLFSRINIPAQTAERNQTGPRRSFLWLLRNKQTNKQGNKPQELPHNSICCLCFAGEPN